MFLLFGAVAMAQQIQVNGLIEQGVIHSSWENFYPDIPLFDTPEVVLQGIVNGTEANANDFPQVVSIVDASGFPFCSGTLIHERWVITAAHCMVGVTPDSVAFGGNLFNQGGLTDLIEVKSFVPHPNYNDQSGEHDLGLIELWDAKTNISVMAVNDEPMNNSWIGRELMFVGFGITGDNANDSGIKRYADIQIEDVYEFVVHSYDPTGQNVCSGDSGGAALEQTPDGYELAGINDYVFGYYGTMCIQGHNGAARVDQHIDWIESYVPSLVKSAAAGTEPGPNPTEPNPGTTNPGTTNPNTNDPNLKPPDIGSRTPVGPEMAAATRPDGYPCGARCNGNPGSASWMLWGLLPVIVGRRRR